MDELLHVEALGRRFGPKPVLSGLDFRLGRGEVLGLLGPNGAGKTTCLRMLSGNLAPSSGRIRIKGFDLEQHPIRARRHLGYLPERPPLYPDMRVDEYLGFVARLRQLPPRGVAAAVQRIKQRCGLEGVGRRLLGKLSKGYQQRAGLAQALIHEPDLVILDEPTDGLDPVQMREVRGLIADLAPSCGVLLSSHALSEVQAVCGRVLILSDGRPVYAATLDRTAAGDALSVRLRNPPPAQALSELPMVETTEALSGAGDGRFRILLSADGSRDALARALVEHDYGLLELTAERTDLERVFFQTLEQAPATAAPAQPVPTDAPEQAA